ncbi:polyprenyl synthetase family protein [Streptomyces sp. TBY4]|uniref:polyprenyl synthetase family protein n=1 Tax=Streptomyces sp. TBY4 TaxID=2962030 RepID=UPI0020B804C9|nr:polyprenyl synthetase family protein [Streptomyces sp. TBY4]MCP3754605.1 polyprenyl synthetase family protein [Streptomyces sp. TBY4]
MIAPLLERVDPPAAEVLAYQWGWRDAEGRPVAEGGRGKAVRAALVFAAARAAGGGPGTEGDSLVRAGAAAVEMLHAVSLLHDDVMDKDEVRRGRPAAWRVFGAAAVESAVGALIPHALELVFLGVPGAPGPVGGPGDLRRLRASARAAGLLGDALVRLAQGQALDLALEEEACPGAGATLRVHADKTGSLFACACALGAAPEAAGELAAFGEHLGIAFQIVDDVLGVWGDPAVTGKPAGADLTARKKSHPVAVALAADVTGTEGSVSRRLHELYAMPGQWNPAQTGEVRRLLDRTGARAVSEAAARAHERLALDALDRVCPPSQQAAGDLRALAAFVVGRAH